VVRYLLVAVVDIVQTPKTIYPFHFFPSSGTGRRAFFFKQSRHGSPHADAYNGGYGSDDGDPALIGWCHVGALIRRFTSTICDFNITPSECHVASRNGRCGVVTPGGE
jgi:hypothetical protein